VPMGTQMPLLLSEHDVADSLFDVSTSNIDSASKTIDSQKPPHRIQLACGLSRWGNVRSRCSLPPTMRRPRRPGHRRSQAASKEGRRHR